MPLPLGSEGTPAAEDEGAVVAAGAGSANWAPIDEEPPIAGLGDIASGAAVFAAEPEGPATALPAEDEVFADLLDLGAIIGLSVLAGAPCCSVALDAVCSDDGATVPVFCGPATLDKVCGNKGAGVRTSAAATAERNVKDVAIVVPPFPPEKRPFELGPRVFPASSDLDSME